MVAEASQVVERVAATLPAPVPRPDPFAACQHDPANLPPLPRGTTFHTCGARILGFDGQPVQISGVSWFGMETGTYAPHGLWTRNWRAMLDQIAALGFNTVRLPFSNDALVPRRMPQGINYDINPDLAGKTSVELMDMLMHGASDRGLKVILDRHRPDSTGQSVSEERWIADWVMLATRYKGQPALLGMDLHNEPRGPATWGSEDPSTDWRLAAQRAGNAILAVNPYVLIFVQGVERSADDWYWWGGNFLNAWGAMVELDVPGRVIYSPHDYGPGVYAQPWFNAPDFPNNQFCDRVTRDAAHQINFIETSFFNASQLRYKGVLAALDYRVATPFLGTGSHLGFNLSYQYLQTLTSQSTAGSTPATLDGTIGYPHNSAVLNISYENGPALLFASPAETICARLLARSLSVASGFPTASAVAVPLIA